MLSTRLPTGVWLEHRTIELEPNQDGDIRVNLLGLGAFSFSLNEATMEGGNVWPFSQMSTSFFSFSYEQVFW